MVRRPKSPSLSGILRLPDPDGTVPRQVVARETFTNRDNPLIGGSRVGYLTGFALVSCLIHMPPTDGGPPSYGFHRSSCLLDCLRVHPQRSCEMTEFSQLNLMYVFCTYLVIYMYFCLSVFLLQYRMYFFITVLHVFFIYFFGFYVYAFAVF
jgi:hypothetical protein